MPSNRGGAHHQAFQALSIKNRKLAGCNGYWGNQWGNAIAGSIVLGDCVSNVRAS
jgi:hypothetical protein